MPEVGVVGRVVGEHVEDEALLDGLAHRVQVERLEPVRRPGRGVPNSSSVLAFGVAVNAKKRQVRLPARAPPPDARGSPRRRRAPPRRPGPRLGRGELSVLARSRPRARASGPSPPRRSARSAPRRRSPRSGAAGSSPILSRTNGNFCSVVMMIRACSPASASASWLESLSIFTTTPVRVLELVDRVLQLPVEHHPVGDHHDLVEHLRVGRVVQRREPVREPGDRVRLARPGRVLDQVVLRPRRARARRPRACSTASHWWKRGKIIRAFAALLAPSTPPSASRRG